MESTYDIAVKNIQTILKPRLEEAKAKGMVLCRVCLQIKEKQFFYKRVSQICKDCLNKSRRLKYANSLDFQKKEKDRLKIYRLAQKLKKESSLP